MYRLRSKLVFLYKPVKVPDNRKDTDLLRNMYIFRKLQILQAPALYMKNRSSDFDSKMF